MQTKEEILQRFSITEDEFEKMYEQAEFLTFLNVSPAKGRPIAVFTGGQPGAGKSGLLLYTLREFEVRGEDIISFDLDSYRAFYKDATTIAKLYPKYYSEITGKAAGRVMERLSEKAIAGGYNFILEGTMGKSAYTLDILRGMDTDYEIVARLMATSKEESLLSIFERYIEMRKSIGIGRMTTVESHNQKYDNFCNVVNKLETTGVEVQVFERSRDVSDIANMVMIYSSCLKCNSRYGSAVEAINAGRKNSKRRTMRNACERLLSIKNDLISFNDFDDLAEEFEKLEEIIHDERKCDFDIV